MFPKWVFDNHQQGVVESGDFQETNSSGESSVGSQGLLTIGQPVSDRTIKMIRVREVLSDAFQVTRLFSVSTKLEVEQNNFKAQKIKKSANLWLDIAYLEWKALLFASGGVALSLHFL